MMRSSRLALLATVALFAVSASAHDYEAQAAAAPATGAVPGGTLIAEADLPADPRFSADRVKSDVAFLSDDLLEGRDTGSVGHEIAARFVAQRFASLGLKPAGDNGSWLQRVTFQKTERVSGPSGIIITGPQGEQSFIQGADALVGMNANDPKLDVSAPLVFVGYGLVEKSLKLDDYAGLNVKGKIVVALRGFPEDLPSETAAYLVSERLKIAQDHGAIGLIAIDTDATAKQRPWVRRVNLASQPSFAWVGADGKAYDETPGLRVTGALDKGGAEAMFAGAPKTLTQVRADAARKGSRPKGFALKTGAHMFSLSKSSRVTSPNVVAMIPGSDPTLASDYVVLSGHLDHIGISPAKAGDPVGKDRINNGAMDNAAGVATLMEVARVISQDKVKPRRSILFLASTGEEKGLLGADYYARHPTVPGNKIVGNVDLDMPVLSYAFTDLVAYGADHSSLGTLVADAVAPMKVKLSPDPTPEETVFVRSDHYMFVKQGVPAVFLATGYANGGEAAWDIFNAKHYHQPSDDMMIANLDWQAGARFAEANYRITLAMANGATTPLWLKGDFFGDTFAPNAGRAPAKP